MSDRARLEVGNAVNERRLRARRAAITLTAAAEARIAERDGARAPDARSGSNCRPRAAVLGASLIRSIM